MEEIDSIKVMRWLKKQIAEEIRQAVLSILIYELHEKFDILWIRKQKEEKKVKPKPCAHP